MYNLSKNENVEHLQTQYNIRISELNSSPEVVEMSQPRKIIHLPKVRMLSHGSRSSSIRITNVKSIKPPDPELVKKQEEERLRAQLQKEIVSRSRTCAYKTYECVLPVVAGRSYCARHILNDITAPYKQCAHVTSSGARCNEPAPAEKDPGLCFEHARAALHARQRSAAPPPPVTTTETLLNQLQHYVRSQEDHEYSCDEEFVEVLEKKPKKFKKRANVEEMSPERSKQILYSSEEEYPPKAAKRLKKIATMSTTPRMSRPSSKKRPERTRTTSCASSVSVVSDPADQEQVATHAVDPFKEIDATSVNAAFSASIMECASASDSECDSVTLGSEGDCRWHDHDDTEDAPSESQPLWRAGVFTAEEAVSEAKNVLKSLQSAYIRQMGRLRTLLQTARLQYVRSLRTEKEQYCSINSQARSGPLTVRERRQLRKLRAYAGYHRKHGVDAVLARKLHHKRAKVNETSNRHIPSHQARCTFVEEGVRCTTHAIPAAKHCMKHILQDRHQVLFAACGDSRGLTACREPVAKLPLPSAACRYHTGPPAYTTFTLKKEETGSDSESPSSSDLSHVEAEEQSPDPEEMLAPEPIDQ